MQRVVLPLVFVFCGLFASSAFSQPIEKLEYVLRYGIIKGGTATLTTTKSNLKNDKTIHLHMRGQTAGITHAVYAVDDIYESWVDPKTSLPVKAIRNIKEKQYSYYNEVTFFHAQDSAYSQKTGSHKIAGNVCDVVSAFFYIRNSGVLNNLKVGQTISLPIWHIDKVSELKVKFRGIETLETDFGKMECIKLQPLVESGKLFKRADSFVMWVSNDERKLPVLFQFNLKIGALKCELQSK